MSDNEVKQLATVDNLRKAFRVSAGEEAEARWKASEERAAREQEERTAYFSVAKKRDEQHIAWEAGAPERHAAHHALNLRLQEANERIAKASEQQAEALNRIADALSKAKP